jgi:CubicO group peptidase (beta-lactamase class C family)
MSTVIGSAAIDKVLHGAVESGAVPNVAAIAANREGVIYEGTAGPRAVGASDPVSVDTMFRIMSMTKMVCTVAALQQVEKGALNLHAPVADYCPEFARLQVLEGFDGDTPKLRPPASQATVKQLITHTTGLGYWFWNEKLVLWEKVTGTPNVVAGSNASFTAPLLFDPGTAFNYGINTDWLGKVVEAVSGVTLDVAIKEGITGPLGMHNTTFLMNDDQRANSTPVHVKGEDGTWKSIGEFSTRPQTGGPAGMVCTPLRATTSGSSRRCCEGVSSTGYGSSSRRRWMPPSPTRSVSWTSRRRSRPPTLQPAAPSGRVLATSGATACCSTLRTGPGCTARGRGPGQACAILTSGWTAPQGSAPRSTATSCLSSRPRR